MADWSASESMMHTSREDSCLCETEKESSGEKAAIIPYYIGFSRERG
jgi:hypothetical protein